MIHSLAAHLLDTAGAQQLIDEMITNINESFAQLLFSCVSFSTSCPGLLIV